jgi:hypothetical protein
MALTVDPMALAVALYVAAVAVMICLFHGAPMMDEG